MMNELTYTRDSARAIAPAKEDSIPLDRQQAAGQEERLETAARVEPRFA